MTQTTVTSKQADLMYVPPSARPGDGPVGRPEGRKVLRRDGTVADFDATKISVAMTKAFIATEGETAEESSRIRDIVQRLTEQVNKVLAQRVPEGGVLHLEHIQDQVELALMRSGEHEVARRYILYREDRAKHRASESVVAIEALIKIKKADGSEEALDLNWYRKTIEDACVNLEDVSAQKVFEASLANLYSGVSEEEVIRSAIFSARSMIEQEPSYAYVAARLLLQHLHHEVFDRYVSQAEMVTQYKNHLKSYIEIGIAQGLLDKRLAEFDLDYLGSAIVAERDLNFQYLGLQTLADRYLIHIEGRQIELPQTFWMRVAMGLAINEQEREKRAVEFYNVLSSFDFVSSTPTLFNSGTARPQLSSCFLTTVDDDLHSIYDSIKDNALLSKFSGGLGNDWTPVRALGAHIKGTNGKSQGVVPFLKVVNDTAVAVNQGGKRKGAVCTYLESWHLDIEEFLELRKNTGDDRRRTHDMNTANWIPDLFMQRVSAGADWTLFSPDDVSDLHDLYGPAFNDAYQRYEALAAAGQIKLFKRIPAVTLWRKMLTMLFETGHPWITFKDACNLRSPQQHVGVVHSSNLCTEITLNTSSSETAVCNLGSINLVAHVSDGKLDLQKLSKTCRVAMRMLDNVIDINFYTVPKARNANFRHRPVGLGVMGFQDVLHLLKIPYASKEAIAFADSSQEAISYFAILASSELAQERGVYATYKSSLWDRGILPQDSIKILEEARGAKTGVAMDSALDWTPVREHIAKWGMRNSNCLAIAPTATISNIAGVSQSIEPTFQNLFVKSNLSGDFTVLDTYLVEELKKRKLWDEVMVHDLKYFDGSLSKIDRVPSELKSLYATAFEIDPSWLIEAAARRQKWIDQSQSLNLYLAEPSGKRLNDTYSLAWQRGLKTTYYLRTKSATAPEKSTIASTTLNAVSVAPQACSITDPDCEACQ